MTSTRVDLDKAEWTSAVPFYGPNAVYQGKDIVQLKVLSDRRGDGGGIAWIVRFLPPPGKLIKIVANALSDEHILNLEGGRGTKTGAPVKAAGGYGLNSTGQPHSAFIGHGDRQLYRLYRRAGRSRVAGGRRPGVRVSAPGRRGSDAGRRGRRRRGGRTVRRCGGGRPRAAAA